DRGRVLREAVVVEQAAQLRLRDRRLAGLDRVQDRGRAELVARGGPSLRAATGLRQPLVVLGPPRPPRSVPQRHVRRLLPRRAARAAGASATTACRYSPA